MPDDRAILRTTFDQVAELYDQARPGYPDVVFDELVALTGLRRSGRVLEVGCGTGQATVPMAERGYRVVAIELGETLAAVARRNLGAFPNAWVHNANFETWPVPAEPFDVVMSASAWHWIDPSVAADKAADALRPGGAVAIIGGPGQVEGGDTDFFNEMQECYERHIPGRPKGLRLTPADSLGPNLWNFEDSGRFHPPVFRRWYVETEYTTATYLDLWNTFSDHIALDPSDRLALLDCLTDLLESRYRGRVRRATLIELCVAARRK